MKNSFRRLHAFSVRVFLEIIRDPISYIFALGFPLVMLLIMTIVNASIPEEAGMTLFEPVNLVPGIAVFGLTFMAMFTSILVSADRAEGFAVRLAVSPMGKWEFFAGYTAPVVILSVVQCLIAFSAGLITASVQGKPLSVVNALAAIAVLIPSMIMFAAVGYIIGILLSQKSAPAASSVMITASSLLGGIWMDTDVLGGVWLDVCRVLPFYHAVKAARLAFAGITDNLAASVTVTLIYAAVFSAAAAVLSVRMKRAC